MEEEISVSIAELAATDISKAIALCAGHLVGLLEIAVSENGGDRNKQIDIEGGSRKITIHQAKPQ